MKIKKEVITSRANPLVLSVAALSKKRERDERGEFVCDGKKLVFEYIKHCGAPRHLFVCEKNQDVLIEQISELEKLFGEELEVTLAGESAFLKMTEQKAPDGIICVGERSRLRYERSNCFSGESAKDERIIMLASLQDSGNVGTVLRTALALGYDRVILSSDCADVLSAKTLRASMGAAFSMGVSVVDDLVLTTELLIGMGRRVFAAELRKNAVALDDIDVRDDDVFVIGNEGHGIDTRLSAMCNKSVYIPISENSESLNAAIAASIFMWHQCGSVK